MVPNEKLQKLKVWILIRHHQNNAMHLKPHPRVNLTTTTDSELESHEFIQVPCGCTWPDGLLVREVAQGLVLMARAEGDKATKFCTVFRGAIWSKPTFSRHQAMWRDLSSNESEAALRLPNHMWKDLYKKVK